MQIGLDEIRSLYLQDRKKLRRRVRRLFLTVILIFLVMCCLRTTTLGLLSPVDAAKNLVFMVRLWLAKLFHWNLYNQRVELIRALTGYYETVTMFRTAVVAAAMGAVLSMAGAVYQCVFRNPIASPSLLGVSSGLKLTNLVLVLCYSTSVYQMVQLRFVVSYGVALGMLLLIYLFSRVMGRKKSSVTDMLLIGTIVMRQVQQLSQSYRYYYLDDEEYLLLEQLDSYGTSAFETSTLLQMLGILFVCTLILVLMRYSLNVVSFEDDDSRTLGIKANRLRMIALVCATMMVITALVSYGDIGMLALLIPHACRYWFGCDFRNVLLGSAGLGAIAMLLCRLIQYSLSFNYYLSMIPVSTIINVITTPLLIIILLQQKRGWT